MARFDGRQRFGVAGAFWLIVATAPLPVLAMGGGGGGAPSGGGGSAAVAKRSPAQIAQDAYERGLRHRDRALEYEAKAKVKDDGFLFFAPPSEKAVRQWEEAARDLRKAVGARRDFPEAQSELGFAYFKLGRYEKALAASDRALALRPGYAPAFAYRGQACLELGRLSDARAVYLRLAATDPARAAELMDAIHAWLADAEQEPVPEVSPAELESFRAWVAEREQIRSAGSGPSDADSW